MNTSATPAPLALVTSQMEIPPAGDARNEAMIAIRRIVGVELTLRLLLDGLERHINDCADAQRLSVTFRMSARDGLTVDSFTLARVAA